jgi:hypothetical protein
MIGAILDISLSKAPQQSGSRNLQSISDDFESAKRHTLTAGFEPIKMRAIEARALRKFVLSDTHSFADPLDLLAHRLINLGQCLRLEGVQLHFTLLKSNNAQERRLLWSVIGADRKLVSIMLIAGTVD